MLSVSETKAEELAREPWQDGKGEQMLAQGTGHTLGITAAIPEPGSTAWDSQCPQHAGGLLSPLAVAGQAQQQQQQCIMTNTTAALENAR